VGNERDRQNKAVIAFRQSLKLNPRNGEGWNSLGATYETLSNYQEAFRCYKQAEALGNSYARQNYDNLKAAAAAANMRSSSTDSSSQDKCGSFSGPARSAGNNSDAGAMDRYQNHQPTPEDKRRYGVE
jgi:tetratricopeptide (TPR) repeat protein